MTTTPPPEGTTEPLCSNCDGRECMACVFREVHDACEKSCPMCCPSPPAPAAEDDAVEKAARAIYAQHAIENAEAGFDVDAWDVIGPTERAAFLRDASRALSALADPDVLDGIAGVIENSGRDVVDCPHDTAGWPCPHCQAAAVVEWLRGERA